MITHLSIKNFAIVSFVEIDWFKGMTTITGETGAGKSIAIDALSLCLGARALTNTVRPDAEKAELTASFDVSENKAVQKWLKANDLNYEEDCIIRRVINKEGRSRAFINGNAVPLGQLKSIGELLINIHGQHDHQLLMKNTEQRRLLDDYANHDKLLAQLKNQQKQWRLLNNELAKLEQAKQQRIAQQQLLQYQVKELDEFNLQEEEFAQLENDFKRNINSQQILQLSQNSLHMLSEDPNNNVLSMLQKCCDDLSQLSDIDSNAKLIKELISESIIQVEEAHSDLSHYVQSIDVDPQAFAYIEERYSTANTIARKHLVSPEKLVEHHVELKSQLNSLSADDNRLEFIHDELNQCLANYNEIAAKLTASRNKYAKTLANKISKSLHQLNMPNAKFEVAINSLSKEPNAFGFDDVEFLVSMNPGQALEPIQKVASGGELSRMSLAIQVILAERVDTPSLIFDEVDVGISGPTAAMVGSQLQALGKNTQVICVTHLPQVACKGDQQLFVAKLTDGKKTHTTVNQLTSKERTHEIARLLAGGKISANSIANAEELLAS